MEVFVVSSAMASKGLGSPSLSGVPRDSMTSRSRTIRILERKVSGPDDREKYREDTYFLPLTEVGL